MGRIPRVALGDRPSAVPQGGAFSPSSIAAPTAALADVAGMGARIASDAEMKEAEKLQRALEAKQAIVNEVEGSTRVANLDATLRESMLAVQKDMADNPDKAVAQFVENARNFMDSEVRDASDFNSAVGLDVARGAQARIAEHTNEMYKWAQIRQTQKTKGQAQEIINRTAAAAEHLNSYDQLQRHIDGAKAQYKEMFTNVYGDEADAKLHEMASQATRGFFAVAGDRNPIGVMSALEDSNGAAAKYLTPSERDSLRRQTKLSLDGRHATRELDIARQAAGENAQALELLNSGQLKAETTLSLIARNEAAQKAAAVDPTFTPEQRKLQVEKLKRQHEALQAVEDIRRRGQRFDPVDHVDADTAMMAQQQKVFHKLKGQPGDLLLLEEQQQRVMLARAKREISDSAFMAMMKDLNTNFDATVKAEQNDTWGIHWMSLQDAREAGNSELNRLFRGRLKNATAKQQAAAWQNYVRQLADAQKSGTPVKADSTRAMARSAASLETGIIIGAND